MKTKKSTKVLAGVLAFLLCVCTAFANPELTKAATKYDSLLDEEGAATAQKAEKHNFTVNINTNVYFAIGVAAPVNCEIGVYNSAGKLYSGSTISVSESDWELSNSAYIYTATAKNMPAGDYSVKVTFAEDAEYVLLVQADKAIATISNKSLTLTAGFTKTLKVNNTKDKITWTSSKKSVATVSSKGVVSAKKPGTATITAKTKSGQKLTCKVTVKANAFKQAKISISSVYYGQCGLQVYGASYISNGDLVLKCKFLNNSGYRVNALKNAKITFKTDAGKTIGTYSASSKSMNVAHGSSKDFTVTIKKSSLKVKKADLRNATYSTSGKYQYRY